MYIFPGFVDDDLKPFLAPRLFQCVYRQRGAESRLSQPVVRSVFQNIYLRCSDLQLVTTESQLGLSRAGAEGKLPVSTGSGF